LTQAVRKPFGEAAAAKNAIAHIETSSTQDIWAVCGLESIGRLTGAAESDLEA
jgi:hypothetical protein